jgi:hypothetical protein
MMQFKLGMLGTGPAVTPPENQIGGWVGVGPGEVTVGSGVGGCGLGFAVGGRGIVQRPTKAWASGAELPVEAVTTTTAGCSKPQPANSAASASSAADRTVVRSEANVMGGSFFSGTCVPPCDVIPHVRVM